MAAKIKKGDKVVVLTGRDKGKSGEVLSVSPKEERVLVRGVNIVQRHQRQTQTRTHEAECAHRDLQRRRPFLCQQRRQRD